MTRAVWLVFLVLLIAVLVAIPFGIRQRYEGFSVPSASMVPTLLPGDYILVDKSVRDPARGDLIVFQDAADATQQLVKRVVGLSGEDVHVAGRQVFVGCDPTAADCQALPEPYADFSDRPVAPDKSGMWHVPAGRFFVMADNRNAGEDSRHYGTVRWQQITGRPFLIYWSSDPGGGIRWGRIGRIH